MAAAALQQQEEGCTQICCKGSKHRRQKTEGDEIMVCNYCCLCESGSALVCVLGCDKNRWEGGRDGMEMGKDRDVDNTNDGGFSVT